MSIDYNSMVAVGFKVTQEEVNKAMELVYDTHGSDEDWDEISDLFLHPLNTWCGGDYIFAEKTITADEGNARSVLGLCKGLNYENYKNLIDAFNKLFPFVDKETHQLDVWLALQVC